MPGKEVLVQMLGGRYHIFCNCAAEFEETLWMLCCSSDKWRALLRSKTGIARFSLKCQERRRATAAAAVMARSVSYITLHVFCTGFCIVL
jgi:hypothetical protein